MWALDLATGPTGRERQMTKYSGHTEPNGGYDQKLNKGLNYFKQNCSIFWFAIQTFLGGRVEKKICEKKALQ